MGTNNEIVSIFIFFVFGTIILFLDGAEKKKKRMKKTRLNSSYRRKQKNEENGEWKTLTKTFKTEKTTSEWILQLLMSLEWKQYEEVCKEFLVIKNHNANVTNTGKDDGIDIEIKNILGEVTTIAQCKAYNTNNKIGVSFIRELFGIMKSKDVENGIFFTTSSYSQDAIEFSKDKNILLIDGKKLIDAIHELTEIEQNQLLIIATQDDYTTPTCPNCDIKMVKRSGKSEFWGCKNYPKCKNTLQIRKK